MTFDSDNTGPSTEGNPFPPAAPFTMKPYNPKRELARNAGLFLAGALVGLVVLLIVVSPRLDNTANPARPAPGFLHNHLKMARKHR